MKSKIYLLLMLLLCLFFNTGKAQKKVNHVLDDFLRSEFMQQFQDMRSEAEKIVLSFKARKYEYSQRDVMRVAQGYNATVTKFNDILREISNDFIDKKRKSHYAQENLIYKLKYHMRDLKDFYAANFVQLIRDVTGDHYEDGSPLIAAFPILIQAFSKIFEQMETIKKHKNALTRELIENKLYRANRFRSWDEIRVAGTGVDDFNQYDSPSGENNSEPDMEDQYPSDYQDNPPNSSPNQEEYPEFPSDDIIDEQDNSEENYRNSQSYPEYNPDNGLHQNTIPNKVIKKKKTKKNYKNTRNFRPTSRNLEKSNHQ